MKLQAIPIVGVLLLVMLMSASARAGAVEISGSLIEVNINFTFTGDFIRNITRPGRPDVLLDFSETPTGFVFSIVGHDFDTTGSLATTIEGDYWRGLVTVTEGAGFINDTLTVNTNFRHRVEPDLNNQPSLALPFSAILVLDASAFPENPGGTISGSLVEVGTRDHLDAPFHVDRYTARLNAAGENTGNFDDITGWNYTLIGQHNPIPEPTTILLLGTGLAGVFAAVRKRRSAKKGEES
jgi:hypothetical protein